MLPAIHFGAGDCVTIFIHGEGGRCLDEPFTDEQEKRLRNTIGQLPAKEFWTLHQLFDGDAISGWEQCEKLRSEIEEAINWNLRGEDELQKLFAYVANTDFVKLEGTDERAER